MVYLMVLCNYRQWRRNRGRGGSLTLILLSAFHQFGWVLGGVINRTNLGGNIRHGKWIYCPSNVSGKKARGGNLCGKTRVSSGSPCSSSSQSGSLPADRYLML